MTGTRRIYAGKDFSTLVSEVRSKLVREFPDVSFDFENDLTVVLLQVVAYALENTHFFQDLQANEVFAETAQLPSFLSKIASFHAYNPAGAVPASGEVGLALNGVQIRTVLLDIGQQFSAANGLTYESTQQVIWPPGDVSEKQVTLAQRSTRFQTFRSDGSRIQRFPLNVIDGQFLSYRSLVVTVDGDEWVEVDRLGDLDTEVYRVAYTADPPFIEFGDDTVGTVPPDGAEIFVRYSETAGLGGVLTSPGGITGLSPPLVVGGVQVAMVLNKSTGVMTGGQPSEVSSLIRANIPLAEHSDQAVVVSDDFVGLVQRYRDPLYGAIAAATAVVATSIDNDLLAALLISQLKSLFVDADSAISVSATALRDVMALISSNASDVDSLASAIISEVSVGGPIRTDTATILSTKDAILTQTNLAADNAETALDIVNTVGGGAGPDALTTSTYNLIVTELNSLRSALASIKANLSSISTTTESIDSLALSIEDDANSIRAEVVTINANVVNHDTSLVSCESGLQDPWNAAVAKIDELEAHLDSILADRECGPNVVSVPILTADADGFFAQPSVGLQRSVENYINARKEPSVFFEVLDGSVYIVTPSIEITFEPLSGEVPSKIKGEGEANIFALLRGFQFGDALNLDDLYDALRSIDNVKSWNVAITSFATSNPGTEVVVDADGNMVVGSLEVVGKPSLTFFRKFPDGLKELI